MSQNSTAVDSHKNVEKVIRYFLLYLPPRGAESILDIGAGRDVPYKGVLQTRCRTYKSLDIRPSENIDFVQDLIKGTTFKDKEWDWSWCSETLEHIPPQHTETVVNEICRISSNIVFTFPLFFSPAFKDDSGHNEVLVDMQSYRKDFQVFDRTTTTGRGIWIFARKDKKILVDKFGILQEGYNTNS